MLYWFNVFTYLGACLLCSLFFNAGLLNLLISGEAIIIIICFICLIVASFFNIYYMFGVSFIILVIFSIEIIFNFLIISSD
jgi:hypothetical protein